MRDVADCGRRKAVRRKRTLAGLVALCGLALLVEHAADHGLNDTGYHLVAGVVMLMAAVIVWCLPTDPYKE
jgi:glucose dehydrogenase